MMASTAYGAEVSYTRIKSVSERDYPLFFHAPNVYALYMAKSATEIYVSSIEPGVGTIVALKKHSARFS